MEVKNKILNSIKKTDFTKNIDFFINQIYGFFIDSCKKNKSIPYVFALRIVGSKIGAKANSEDKVIDQEKKWEIITWKYNYKYLENILDSFEYKLQNIINKINAGNTELKKEDFEEIDYNIKLKIGQALKKCIGDKAETDQVLIGVWEGKSITENELKVIKEINTEQVFALHKNTFNPIKSKLLNKKSTVPEINYTKRYRERIKEVKENVLAIFEREDVKSLAHQGLLNGFEKFKKMTGNEIIYVFGIHTSNEFNGLSIIGNTQECLEKELKNGPDEMKFIKWSFGDWGYSFKIEIEELNKLRSIFDEMTNYYWFDAREVEFGSKNEFDYFYEPFFDKFYPEVEMKVLNLFKNAFTEIKPQLQGAVLLFWNGDPSQKNLMKTIKEINTPEAAKIFYKEFFKTE